jgi:hypothetical protein
MLLSTISQGLPNMLTPRLHFSPAGDGGAFLLLISFSVSEVSSTSGRVPPLRAGYAMALAKTSPGWPAKN